MVRIKVFVEGGGDSGALRSKCRMGFREFFKKAGLDGKALSIRSCGGRKAAYDKFCTAIANGQSDELPILLVDSEDPVPSGKKSWTFLKDRDADRWPKPKGASDNQAHLMVQCMEAWFMADKDVLAVYYKKDFRANALPARKDIEEIPKPDIYERLKKATKDTSKKEYSKGAHSFDILALIDPQKVMEHSPHARKLIDTLNEISER